MQEEQQVVLARDYTKTTRTEEDGSVVETFVQREYTLAEQMREVGKTLIVGGTVVAGGLAIWIAADKTWGAYQNHKHNKAQRVRDAIKKSLTTGAPEAKLEDPQTEVAGGKETDAVNQ